MASKLATVAASSEWPVERPIGKGNVLQVAKRSAERVDDQWTKTVAKLQSVIGEEVLPVCIGRPFVEGLSSSKPDMAGMIVI